MVETIAVIPARAGSERVPGKNVRMLDGHPLIAYSIGSAIASGVCDRVVVSTDSETIAEIARDYGAEVPGLRPAEISTSAAHDIGFLTHAMTEWVPETDGQLWAILRPTSPLRSGESIRAARDQLIEAHWADSVRAVRPVTEHPAKMWRWDSTSGEISTYLDQAGAFNGPISDKEELFLQASSLEIVRRGAVTAHNSIAGARVLGFSLPDSESHDINTLHDWIVLETLVSQNPGLLPRLNKGVS